MKSLERKQFSKEFAHRPISYNTGISSHLKGLGFVEQFINFLLSFFLPDLCVSASLIICGIITFIISLHQYLLTSVASVHQVVFLHLHGLHLLFDGLHFEWLFAKHLISNIDQILWVYWNSTAFFFKSFSISNLNESMQAVKLQKSHG